MKLKKLLVIFILAGLACLSFTPALTAEIITRHEKTDSIDNIVTIENTPVVALNANANDEPNYSPGDVLVVFKSPQTTNNVTSDMTQSYVTYANSVMSSVGGTVTRTYSNLSQATGDVFALVHSDTIPEEDLLAQLRARPDVAAASLNYKNILYDDGVTPNDSLYDRLWGMKAIKAPEAWTNITGSHNVYVAVIDSGVDYNHQDIESNFEASYSRSFAVGKAETQYDDENGHGTHVAGTIGAVGNNGIGVAGVNWQTKIISIRIFDASGSCWDEEIVKALDYLLGLLNANPNLTIAAANMSYGKSLMDTPPESTKNWPEYLAMKALSDTGRILMCVAAGNNGVEIGSSTYAYPASYTGLDNMIVVANALNNSSYTRSGTSNYSKQFVDIAAPGTSILSTAPDSCTLVSLYPNSVIKENGNTYLSISGTSMATPHVAGTVALLKAAFPDASVQNIKSAILSGANPNYATSYTAHGFLDTSKALGILAENFSKNTAPKILTSSLPKGYAKEPYSAAFSASGTRPITWSIEGNMPNGLELSASEGRITGTPSAEGKFELTVKAANNYGSDTAKLELVITDGKPEIKNISLPDGEVYTSYSGNLEANGHKPFKWSITDGTLPKSMTFDENGNFSGTPQESGTWHLTVKAENNTGSDTKEIDLVIKGVEPVIITGDTIPSAFVGVPYSYKLDVLGTQPIKWSIEEGNLPDGMSLDAKTGVISGTASTAGDVAKFIVRAENNAGYSTQYIQYFTVKAAPPEGLKIITDSLPLFVYGVPYYARLEAESTSPVTWSLVQNLNFPQGLTLNSDGTITGLPVNWNYILNSYIDVKATNSSGSVVKRIQTAVNEYNKTILSEHMPDGQVGQPYDVSISATGPYSQVWVFEDGSLPPGLDFVSNSNWAAFSAITGTPTEAGIYTFTLKTAWRAGWYMSDTKTFTIKITEDMLPPVIKTKSLPEGTVGVPYDGQVIASGTLPTVSITGDNPTGLSVWYGSGVIEGTPSKAGEYTLKATATNSAGSDAKDFKLIIREQRDVKKPEITTQSLADGIAGVFYEDALQYEGASVTWSIVDGSLPEGLKLSANGRIFGTPAQNGKYSFKARAVNFAGEYTRDFTLIIGTFDDDDDDNSDKHELSLHVDSFAYAGFTDGAASYSNARLGNINAWLDSNSNTDFTVITENGITSRQPDGQGNSARIGDAFTVNAGDGSYQYKGAGYHEVASGTAKTFDIVKRDGTWYLAESGNDSSVSFTQDSDAALKGRKLEWNIYASGIENGSVTLGDLLTVNEQLEKPVPFVSLTDDGKLAWSFVKSSDVSTPVAPELDGKLTIQIDIKDGMGKKIIFPVKDYELKSDEIAKGTIDEQVKISDVMEIYATVETENIAYTWCFFTEEYDVPESPKITTNANLSRAFRNLEYIYRLSSDSNASWDVISGKLPDGLSLNSSGIIAGTPTKTGTYSFIVQIENDYGIDSKTFYIAVENSSVEIVIESGQADATITTGSKYEALLRASADVAISLWEIGVFNANVFGDNNEYLAIDSVLEYEGIYTFTAKAYDLAGNYGDISLKVDVIAPPKIMTTQIPDGTAGSEYSVMFNASGTAPITWQLTGTIPEGLAFDPATATLYGTPSQAGTYSFTLEASNSAGLDARSFILAIEEITTPSEQPVLPSEPDEQENETGQDEAQHETVYEQTQSHSDYIEEATKVIREKFGDIPVIDLFADTGAYVNYRQSIESVQSMTEQEVAAVLPDIQVGSEGVYLIEVAFENSIPIGSYIIWNPFGVTSSSSGTMSLMSTKYFAAAQGSDDDDEYTFLDDDGNEIAQPTQREYDHFTVAAHFKANTLYSPVITLEDADTTSQPEETPSQPAQQAGQAQEAQEANSEIAEDSNMPEESNNIQPEVVTVNGNVATPADDRQTPANRSVSSPASSTPESNSTEAPEESGSGSAGGGGCDVGASVLGLAILAIILRRYR